MNIFFEIASKISTPLALGGFVSASVFLLFRQILEKDIFSKLTKQSTAIIITKIIDRIFILSLVSMLTGGLAYFVQFFIYTDKEYVSPVKIEMKKWTLKGRDFSWFELMVPTDWNKAYGQIGFEPDAFHAAANPSVAVSANSMFLFDSQENPVNEDVIIELKEKGIEIDQAQKIQIMVFQWKEGIATMAVKRNAYIWEEKIIEDNDKYITLNLLTHAYGKSYEVWCKSPENLYKEYKPIFQEILESVTVNFSE